MMRPCSPQFPTSGGRQNESFYSSLTESANNVGRDCRFQVEHIPVGNGGHFAKMTLTQRHFPGCKFTSISGRTLPKNRVKYCLTATNLQLPGWENFPAGTFHYLPLFAVCSGADYSCIVVLFMIACFHVTRLCTGRIPAYKFFVSGFRPPSPPQVYWR